MPSDVKVTVQPIGSVKVQVGPQQGGAVRSINYGNRTIKGSTDLSMGSAENYDAIIYNANTNSFVLAPVSGAVTNIDAGEF